MTKTITKTTFAILALGLSVPAMAATDGTAGATSTGTMQVNLQVNPPVSETVHIYGLDNITLPEINRVANLNSASVVSVEPFCIVRSILTGGPVNFTVTQLGGPSATGKYSLNGTNGKILDGISVTLQKYTGGSGGISSDVEGSAGTATSSSPASCSVGNIADGMAIQIVTPQIPFNSTASDGALSQTFTITTSLP